MEKNAARHLVRDTLQHPFERDRFYRFSKELLNHFEDASFTYQGNYVPDAYKPFIQTLERLGKYQDPDGNKIDVLIAQLKKGSSLERARTMQRNFIAWYLNGSRGGEFKDAALVAFVSPDSEDWRFSLVTMEYRFAETPTGKVKAQAEYTPARRSSFLVGEHETSHTAQSRLVPIIEDDEHDPTLSQIEEAFNIEKATKEFFGKYRELFNEVVEELEKLVASDKTIKRDFEAKSVNTADFAKKLLGQIVFLYFLQKKGWFGVRRHQPWGSGSKHFLRELFEKKHGDYENFFNDVLEPLFYEALRLDRPEDYYSRFDCRIPFLNGGLFDPLNDYDWIETDILIRNELFSNSIKTKEGDIGSGILDIFDRYNFTVNEDEPLEKEVAVDPEMLGKVFENLLEVKDRKSKGTYYTPREIVHYMCQESLINYLATELEGKVAKEEVETLVRFGETVVEHESRVVREGRETRDYSFKLPESIRDNAKLIDAKLQTIRICDPAVGSGAFPVGMMSEIIRARNALSSHMGNGKGRTMYDFKRHAIQECLYGVDIDPGAIEIAKLRLWLSLVVDEEERGTIQPLPNLDYKLVCGNSLLGVERDLFNQQLFASLEALKQQFFSETSSKRKRALKQQIDELILKLTKGHKDFDFEVYFSEVFHEKKGFDVVIGNPPYGADLDTEEKRLLDTRFADLKSSNKNSAMYFIYTAQRIMSPQGCNSFIVPKSICYSLGWGRCAGFLLPSLVKLIDTGKAFEKVKLEQVVYVARYDRAQEFFRNGLYAEDVVNEFGLVSKGMFREHGVLLAGQLPEELALIQKIVENCPAKFGDYVRIKRGLNWQSQAGKSPGRTPVHRGAQLSPYWLWEACDHVSLSKFDEREYRYQFAPKILNQLAIAHVRNPYPHFFLQAALDLENRLVFETISCTFLKHSELDIRFVLGLNNSRLFAWLLYKFVYSNAIRSTRYDEQYVARLPCPELRTCESSEIATLAGRILALKKRDPEADVTAVQEEIDRLVYALYGLTDDEIAIVEGHC